MLSPAPRFRWSPEGSYLRKLVRTYIEQQKRTWYDKPKLTGLPLGLDFYPYTHPIPAKKPEGISAEPPYTWKPWLSKCCTYCLFVLSFIHITMVFVVFDIAIKDSVSKRKSKFLLNYSVTDNAVCSLLAVNALQELSMFKLFSPPGMLPGRLYILPMYFLYFLLFLLLFFNGRPMSKEISESTERIFTKFKHLVRAM